MASTTTASADLVSEAKRITGLCTKREVIELALKELIRRRKAELLIGMFGKTPLAMTAEDLQALREMDMPLPSEPAAEAVRPRARARSARAVPA